MQTSYEKISLTKPVLRIPYIDRRIEIVSNDGLILRGWQIESKKAAKGNIVIVHGFKDYAERYLEFANDLANSGYQVFAYDQRGHGRSDGERAYFPDFETVTDDLKLAMETFKSYDNKRPWVVLGHSIGASVAARYALINEDELAGFILSAPALKKMPQLQSYMVNALKVTNFIAPHLGVLDLPSENFSRDPEVVEKLRKDPLINQNKVPARSALSALDNMEFVQENKFRASIPFLILHGSHDLINNIEGSREFFDETPNIPGKDMKIYPTLAHDLLHEPEHLKVQQDIIDWLDLISGRKNIGNPRMVS